MDINVQAYRLVQQAVDETPQGKDRRAAARKGGKKGGTSRARALTPERRMQIAMLANEARWKRVEA